MRYFTKGIKRHADICVNERSARKRRKLIDIQSNRLENYIFSLLSNMQAHTSPAKGPTSAFQANGMVELAGSSNTLKNQPERIYAQRPITGNNNSQLCTFGLRRLAEKSLVAMGRLAFVFTFAKYEFRSNARPKESGSPLLTSL
ncbi:hypothetical protein [uncultured Microbulbifer sp.]|uniref:hypothetical protein n=1 Tax=uncultured Microbulbifer sp. TaxID=348147 RepID=UPI0026118B0B|nr:hypothetical protein [uncultured Microbulbifer sp.]